LNKWEHEREKNVNRQERAEQKEAYAQSKIDVDNNQRQIKDTNKDLHQEQHDFKKASRIEAKNVTKGKQDQRQETVNFGGFIFEERVEGTGPKCQAERDLEELSVYTQVCHLTAAPFSVICLSFRFLNLLFIYFYVYFYVCCVSEMRSLLLLMQ
jgi:hypothetical protein